MKKEIDAIRAKDIAQGGLTQGQQTQIARNEQRTSQVYELGFICYLYSKSCASLSYTTIYVFSVFILAEYREMQFYYIKQI